MPLQFPSEWRFEQDPSPMPGNGVGGAVSLVEDIAASSGKMKSVYETVKHRFGNASVSTSTSWAHDDMVSAMESLARNGALFVEALWSALEDLANGGVPVPSVEQVNEMLAQWEAGYILDPPHLRRPMPIGVATGVESRPVTRSNLGYVLGERVGGGGFGEVFRARRNSGVATFDVAIKIHHPSGLRSSEKSLKRFVREVAAVQKLQHRGVVQYLDAGVNEKGQPFLVMPMIDGPNLRDATSPSRAAAACGLLVEVLRALHHAHENDVMHRDLKPPNILVRSSDGQPIIVDFGLAYVFDDATPESLTTGAPGSAGYIPPEILVNPKARSPLHDVYSCGVILYEMFARRLPEDPRSVEPLTRIDSKLAVVDEVVRKALAPAARRFQTAAEMLRALKAARRKLRAVADDAA